jgi:hypothetical protein
VLLIATDEAGYGPKLGPLVIVSTVWRIPGDELDADDLMALFAPLRAAYDCGGSRVVVDDSKVVYSRSAGLDALHAVVSASFHWCGYEESSLDPVLRRIAADDVTAIAKPPWLGMPRDTPFLTRETTNPLRQRWQDSGIELVDVKARIITAEVFNAACENGCNKADLLSEASVGLVRSLVDLHGGSEGRIAVYCDRHGGRRYYAGVLQHVFPDSRLAVVSEAKPQSVYRLTTEVSQQIDVHFTVKGDSFTPVALSSMHAKYLRERLMESFNAYFGQRHRESTPLAPTAGYPVDADRFLADIAPIIAREKIDPRKLVRSR